MTLKLLLAAGLIAALAAPALADETKTDGPQVCLRIGQILNWQAPDDHTLIVEDYTHQKFKLSLMGTCVGLNFRQTVGFKSVGGTELSCITPGDYVFTHVMALHQHCPVKTIEIYTPEMEKADKAAKEAKRSQ
ncbi:MAG TPA: DUF6491 family protein [Rhizomicrobium sp.]|nr:DUF6491 family protein [Rhizomicrobium sp.]